MDIQIIKQMIEDGFAIRKVAEEMAIAPKEMKKIVIDYGFALKLEPFIEDCKSHIIDLYKAGVSAKTLGIKYSIGKRKIQSWAKEEGILRGRNESHRMHFFNEHIFDSIDTPEKAYWLGFLYADCYNEQTYNHSISLKLKSTDRDHIKKFCNFMGYKGDLIKTEKSKDKKYEHSGICINSIHLSEQLAKLGCPQAKSLILTFPEWLNKYLISHFIRGYFDGDGSIKRTTKTKEWSWSIAGTKEFCNSVKKNFIDAIQVSDVKLRYISETDTNSWVLRYGGNLQIRKICDWIYTNATIYLDRKYDRYLQLKEQNAIQHSNLVKYSFHKFLQINNIIMSKENISIMEIDNKIKLIEPITNHIIDNGFVFPDRSSKVISEWEKLCKYKPNLDTIELDNTSRLATYICKYFCHSFFSARTGDNESVVSAFSNIDKIKQAVECRLGLSDKMKVANNISPITIIDTLKDLRLAANISIFKPTIAKYMCEKYSNEGDTVGDYSCGFGGRLLGAMSCNRKYIGTDPLTAEDLKKMIDFFGFKGCQVLEQGSEYYKGQENSIDLYWSSPPYYDQEIYSDSLTQAYNRGRYHFYNEYWRKTLENIKYMLKPGKWFGVNIGKNYYKLVEIAQEYFGDIIEEVYLCSFRGHFVNHKQKKEAIYMFRNNK